MQTKQDARQIQALGAAQERLRVLGNLKYDPVGPDDALQNTRLEIADLNLSGSPEIWLCGSTHPGEEETLISVYMELHTLHPELTMIIAPRDPARGSDIAAIAEQRGLPASLRTQVNKVAAPLIILDTIGELAQCYRFARVAFIGGSLVASGGHNPLEAAIYGVPTVFGPHMEDFQEIAGDLVRGGAAKTVTDPDELTKTVDLLLTDAAAHDRMSLAARNLTSRKKSVVADHIDCIEDLLDTSRKE